MAEPFGSFVLRDGRLDPTPGDGEPFVSSVLRNPLGYTFTPSEPGFGLYGAVGNPEQYAGGLFGAVVVAEAAAPLVDLDAVVVFFPCPTSESSAPTPISRRSS